MTETDSEVSDFELTNPVTFTPDPSIHLDLTQEKNSEKIRQLIETRQKDGYTWTPLVSDPLTAGKKVIKERKVQVAATPEILERIKYASNKQQQSSFVIQDRFKSAWIKHFGDRLDSENDIPFTDAQKELLFPLLNQMDISLLCKSEEDIKVEEEYRALYCLQAMQIAMTARSRILRHTQAHLLDSNKPVERDQGFTRPQTLIILPFRNAAFDCVKFMATLWKDRTGGGAGTQVENYSRFEEEYGPARPEDPEEAESLAESQKRDRRPETFKHLFRDNIDDCFRLGIKFTRKSMKLFADFYSADVIIASPLGLRLIIDGADKNMKSGGDWDFLSSIELLVVDQVDALLMQNWEHLERVMAHLNRIPKKPHGCDFSRVRSVFLDGNARNIRQSLVFSRFPVPELNALLNNPDYFCNCVGHWKATVRGVQSVQQLRSLAVASNSPAFFLLPMKSERTNPTDVMAAARFNFFCGKIVPALMRLMDSGTLPDGICIYIPSYYDFCQVRAHLKKANDDGLLPDFVHLSEYTSNSDISRARAKFFNGLAKILLVSERFYYFRRYQIRGIRHLIFYGLPEFPEFFTEWIGMIGNVRKQDEEESSAVSVKKRKLKPVKAGELDISAEDVPTLIAPLDILKLERIVGIEKARELLEN